MKAVDTKNGEFNKIIADLESLKHDGTKEGDQLRNAAVNYYNALKELHLFDRKEIEQQVLINQLPNDKVKGAQDELIVLERKKNPFIQKFTSRKVC